MTVANLVKVKPECGAKLRRKDALCRSTILFQNGRCKIHGGLTPSGPAAHQFIDGKQSKYMYLPPTLTARVEQLAGDVIQNLEQSVDIQKALESRLMEEFQEGGGVEKWRDLKAEAIRYRDAVDLAEKMEQEPPDAQEWLNQIIEAIADGSQIALAEESLRIKLQSLHETQRKLTETITKCRKEQQETYTQEQWNVMMNLVYLSLQKILDADKLRQFTTNLDAYRQQGSGQPRALIGSVKA
jgi:hypothetical protein